MKKKEHFYIDKTDFMSRSAAVCFPLAVLFLLIGTIGTYSDSFFVMTGIALPVAACILMSACIMLLPKFPVISILPVVMIMVYFALGSIDAGSVLVIVITIILCACAIVLSCLTLIYRIKTKWFMASFFAAVFVCKIALQDVPGLQSFSFLEGMQEMAALFMLLGMICFSFALKKYKPESDVELPPIKAPVVKPGVTHPINNYEPEKENELEPVVPFACETVTAEQEEAPVGTIGEQYAEESRAETEIIIPPDEVLTESDAETETAETECAETQQNSFRVTEVEDNSPDIHLTGKAVLNGLRNKFIKKSGKDDKV